MRKLVFINQEKESTKPKLQIDSSMLLKKIEEMNKDKINYSIKEAAEILNISYDFVRENILRGNINAVSYGDRKMINVFELSRILVEGV